MTYETPYSLLHTLVLLLSLNACHPIDTADLSELDQAPGKSVHKIEPILRSRASELFGKAIDFAHFDKELMLNNAASITISGLNKSEGYAISSIPIISNGGSYGLMFYDEHNDQFSYSGNAELTELLRASPVCGSMDNLVANFLFYYHTSTFTSNIELLNEYLVQLEQLTCDDKSYSLTITGTRYEIDGFDEYGTPIATIVSYQYLQRFACAPYDYVGTSPLNTTDHWDNFVHGNGGPLTTVSTPDINEDLDALTRFLRNWAVEECGYSFDNIGRLNQGAGQIFENSVLDAFGLSRNNTILPSSLRDRRSGGARSGVQPDAITNLFAPTASDPFRVFPLQYHEVKAYSSAVRLSCDRWQIEGEIDAIRRAADAYDLPDNILPHFYIYTTAIGTIHPDVVTYATERNVILYHISASINESTGGVSFNRMEPLTLSFDGLMHFHMPQIFANAELRCPPSAPNNRLDQPSYTDEPCN